MSFAGLAESLRAHCTGVAGTTGEGRGTGEWQDRPQRAQSTQTIFQLCKWLVINIGVLMQVGIGVMYAFVVEVVMHGNGRGGYSGIRGDITA